MGLRLFSEKLLKRFDKLYPKLEIKELTKQLRKEFPGDFKGRKVVPQTWWGLAHRRGIKYEGTTKATRTKKARAAKKETKKKTELSHCISFYGVDFPVDFFIDVLTVAATYKYNSLAEIIRAVGPEYNLVDPKYANVIAFLKHKLGTTYTQIKQVGCTPALEALSDFVVRDIAQKLHDKNWRNSAIAERISADYPVFGKITTEEVKAVLDAPQKKTQARRKSVDGNVKITIQGGSLHFTRSIPEIQALELLNSLISLIEEDARLINVEEDENAPVQFIIDGANIQYRCGIDRKLMMQLMKQLLDMTLKT